mmetsp:Transcript_1582/g.3857  ORF Transcript_1582/g.3857 Transcript_1582/m.3857 type:complete len:415 (-) Transcript_1582:83-1327(-)
MEKQAGTSIIRVSVVQSGGRLVLEGWPMRSYSTGLDLKHFVMIATRIPPRLQHLSQRFEALSDDVTLADCGVKDGAMLTLVVGQFEWKPMVFMVDHCRQGCVLQGQPIPLECSVAFWLKSSTEDAHGTVVSRRSHDVTGWRVEVGKGLKIRLASMGEPWLFREKNYTSFSVDQWHHFVVVFNRQAAMATYYIDGVQRVAFDLRGSRLLADSAHAIVVGQEQDEIAGFGLQGPQRLSEGRLPSGFQLVEFTVWESVLSPADVVGLFSGNLAPGTLPQDSPPAAVAAALVDESREDVSQKSNCVAFGAGHCHYHLDGLSSTLSTMSSVPDSRAPLGPARFCADGEERLFVEHSAPTLPKNNVFLATSDVPKFPADTRAHGVNGFMKFCGMLCLLACASSPEEFGSPSSGKYFHRFR